jgi:hypothetical protein
VTSETEVWAAYEQAVALAGSRSELDALIKAKYVAQPVACRTLDTELAAIQSVIADLAPATTKPVAVSVPAIPATTKDEHFAVYAAITDPAERTNYFQAHSEIMFGAPAEPPREKTDSEIKAEFGLIADPIARGVFFQKHEKAICAR